MKCNKCKTDKDLKSFDKDRKICKFCRKLQNKNLILKKSNEGITKICIECDLELNIIKFSGKLCNSCCWNKKVNKKKQLPDNYKDILIENNKFPKNCVECNINFDKNLFKYDSCNKRFRSSCKSCINKRMYHKTYRNKKRNENLEKYLNHTRNIHKLWIEKNKEKMKIWFDEYNKTIDRKVGNFIGNAKKKGFINLDKIDILKPIFKELMEMKCFYCEFYDENKYNGIDRVDSTKNYQFGNIVSCCYQCNMMKNTLDIKTFIYHVQKIVKENFNKDLELISFNNNIKYQETKLVYYEKYKNNSLNRNIYFNLNEIEYNNFKKENYCKYCNFYGKIGIDRINNNIGYEINNCISCCKICNIMKNKNNKDLFLNQCFNIYNNINETILKLCKKTSFTKILNKRYLKNNEIYKIECNNCKILKTGFCCEEHSYNYFLTKQKL